MRLRILFMIAFPLLVSSISFAQSKKQIEVLTLGSFHFNFPNLDLVKTDSEDKIDVLESKYQAEIVDIVKRIAKFRPTIIVIEREPIQQKKYDSLYNQYLLGRHSLRRNEIEQIGFRIAKIMNLKTLYCVDSWGRDYESLSAILEQRDSIGYKLFINHFNKSAETLQQYFPKPVFKTKGIKAELISLNDANNIKKDLGTYLLGIFKYETSENAFFGPDYVTGWWFNRNLRIFRNIQRVNPKSTDRVLVIYGAGHMSLLNLFFESSPEYKLRKVNDYLK